MKRNFHLQVGEPAWALELCYPVLSHNTVFDSDHICKVDVVHAFDFPTFRMPGCILCLTVSTTDGTPKKKAYKVSPILNWTVGSSRFASTPVDSQERLCQQH